MGANCLHVSASGQFYLWRSNKRLESLLAESVQFTCLVVSDSLQPCGLQHARLPCPSPTPGARSNSCPSSQWRQPTISSSVVPFSSCLQSFPTQTLPGRSGSVSVGPSGVHKVLFEPSKHLWWVWGLILNAILPLLQSCWGFSFAVECGVSFFGGIQRYPANGHSAMSCFPQH